MDIKNIALVRATNVIPFDGKVHPLKDAPFLKKESGTVFSGELFSLLRRKGLLQPIDWESSEAERQDVAQKNKEIVAQYMPYTSMYNSMVLWSLNGLVPDDAFNEFSKKSCAIIDGLEEQVGKAELVSLVPTDTAIKGTVTLSKNAIILISKERYEVLSKEEKEQLDKLNLKVDIFEGDLKTAIDTTLVETGRYTAENLGLVSEGGGYKELDTSAELMDLVNNIAKEKQIPQVLHDKIFRGETDGQQKLEGVKGELEQCNVVSAFYKQAFFEYLFSQMAIAEGVKECALYFPDSSKYMEDLCDEIGRIGIDKYKSLVDEYNKFLEHLRETGKLPTPQEIVTATRENRKIDLVSMIEEHNREDFVLSSAIETTKEVTRTGVLFEEIGNFRRLSKEQEKGTKGEEVK